MYQKQNRNAHPWTPGSWRGKDTSAPHTIGTSLPSAKLGRSDQFICARAAIVPGNPPHMPPPSGLGTPRTPPNLERPSHTSALDLRYPSKPTQNSSIFAMLSILWPHSIQCFSFFLTLGGSGSPTVYRVRTPSAHTHKWSDVHPAVWEARHTSSNVTALVKPRETIKIPMSSPTFWDSDEPQWNWSLRFFPQKTSQVIPICKQSLRMTSSFSFISLQLSPPCQTACLKAMSFILLSLRYMVAEAGFPSTLPPLARGSETRLLGAFEKWKRAAMGRSRQ